MHNKCAERVINEECMTLSCKADTCLETSACEISSILAVLVQP